MLLGKKIAIGEILVEIENWRTTCDVCCGITRAGDKVIRPITPDNYRLFYVNYRQLWIALQVAVKTLVNNS
jgi:hypothetical protein